MSFVTDTLLRLSRESGISFEEVITLFQIQDTGMGPALWVNPIFRRALAPANHHRIIPADSDRLPPSIIGWAQAVRNILTNDGWL